MNMHEIRIGGVTLNLINNNLLQLVFSACVAAVKCRPLLHHCVVIFFWSSGNIDCMLFTCKHRVPLMRLGASVVWHLYFH